MKNISYIISLFCCLLFTVVCLGNDSVAKTAARELQIDTTDVTQQEFDENFKTKYSDDAFVYEPKKRELSEWEKFKERVANWFKERFDFKDDGAADKFTTWLLRIVATIIILLCVYLIAKSILNKEGQWIFGKNSDRGVLRYDDVEKNLMQTDFEKLIAETESKGEMRLAIRYYYLFLLRKLAAREIIEWDVEKTNSDYFNEIRDEDIKKEFGFLSYAYNYIWYGEFDIDESTYQKTRTAFIKILKRL